MMLAAWSDFNGANLRLHPLRLADGIGVFAQNMRLGSADLRALNAPATAVATGGATPLISAYRMNAGVVSDTADWLRWITDVDVVRSLIATDSTEEIYYTGDGAPKTTDNVLGLPAAPGPAAWRYLGIPAPATQMGAPTVLVAGSGTTETRVYVDTYVNDRDRESAPGITRTVSVLAGSTMTIPSLSSVPGGRPDITLRRIYCSTDGGDYRLVVEQAASTTTATDSLARSYVMASGGDASRPAWLEPPTSLAGLISLHNGMIGGFTGKRYAVCVAGKPWAWPVEYQETLPFDIVASAKWLQNWLILTKAQPYLVTGSSPDNLSNTPLPFKQSCVSKRSAVGMGHGVAWAGPRGLCYVGEGGARIVTDGILTQAQWEAMVPSSIIGAMWERFYIGFYNDGAAKGFMIDPRDQGMGIVYLTQGANGAYLDPLSDRLYLLDTGNTIKRWHPSSGTSALSATFKTGIKRLNRMSNAGVGLVIADSPISVALTVWAYIQQADGSFAWTVVLSSTVTAGQAFMMPSGYMAQQYQAQLVTSGPVQGFMLAEDVDDLV